MSATVCLIPYVSGSPGTIRFFRLLHPYSHKPFLRSACLKEREKKNLRRECEVTIVPIANPYVCLRFPLSAGGRNVRVGFHVIVTDQPSYLLVEAYLCRRSNFRRRISSFRFSWRLRQLHGFTYINHSTRSKHLTQS